MTLDTKAALPDDSYAWCSDCPWRNDSEWAHKHGQAHAAMLGHIVHVYVPEDPICGDVHLGTFSEAYDCTRERGHSGDHSHLSGVAWSQVENPVEKRR